MSVKIIIDDSAETDKVMLTGSDFSHPKLKGLTIDQIKERATLHRDGSELITRDATTLTDDTTGTINLGYQYTGPAYFKYFNNVNCEQ